MQVLQNYRTISIIIIVGVVVGCRAVADEAQDVGMTEDGLAVTQLSGGDFPDGATFQEFGADQNDPQSADTQQQDQQSRVQDECTYAKKGRALLIESLESGMASEEFSRWIMDGLTNEDVIYGVIATAMLMDAIESSMSLYHLRRALRAQKNPSASIEFDALDVTD